VDDDRGTLVAVGSETEPVSKNDAFLAFAQKVLETVEQDGPEAAEKLEDERVDLVGKIGENIAIRGASRFDRDGDETIAATSSARDKISVLVRIRGSAELMKRVCTSPSQRRGRSRDEVRREVRPSARST
jgi:translation elongation factor EF-Ts